jgi:YD repeat-containing protein
MSQGGGTYHYDWGGSAPAYDYPERYILSDREGMRQIFARPRAWPRADRFPLWRLEDRHGIVHQLSYDAEGRLERVEDHAGRFLQFHYGDCGLLEGLSDRTGRSWRYVHDSDVEHLICVITPGTPDFPDGVSTNTNMIAIVNIQLCSTTSFA